MTYALCLLQKCLKYNRMARKTIIKSISLFLEVCPLVTVDLWVSVMTIWLISHMDHHSSPIPFAARSLSHTQCTDLCSFFEVLMDTSVCKAKIVP